MANMSVAYGKIYFCPEEFAKAHEAEILDFINNFESAYYGVCDMYDYDKDEHSVSFRGAGRWTFDNTLQATGGFASYGADYEPNRKFLELLSREDGSLRFEFTDYEPGLEVLYEATVDVAFTRSGSEYEPAYCGGDYVDYDFTDRALVDLGCEDGVSAEHFVKSKDYDEVKAVLHERTGLDDDGLMNAIMDHPLLDGYVCSWRFDDACSVEDLADMLTPYN